MRALRVLLVLVCACSAAGCYVASLTSLSDAASTTFDEALLGRWNNAEDDSHLELTRDEWSTYAVLYRDSMGEQRWTGRLTPIGTKRFFDITMAAGNESSPVLLPVHIIGRVALQDDRLDVEILSYEWFRGRLRRGTLTTTAVLDDRETILLTAPRDRLRRWLEVNAGVGPLFADAMTFTKEREGQ
jgi:hypothetical protein